MPKEVGVSREVSLRPVWVETGLLKRAILHTLSYADVFDYPLTTSEVHRYLTAQQATVGEVGQALDEMADSCTIVRIGKWFVLPGRALLAEIRHRRSEIATDLWHKAVRYGRVIALLPFVRMVAVTGSLAMYNTEQGKDIDFMLVTAANRLWTCRALVIVVARLAALEGVNLCPNYLVTTSALDFHERSLYVAHEVTQMIPLSGFDIYCQIRSLNAWTDDYLPNAQGMPHPYPGVKSSSRWQRLLEAPLALVPVGRFEQWEMKRKIGKLSREQSSSLEAYFSADVCKGHLDRHKQRTETLLDERWKGLNPL